MKYAQIIQGIVHGVYEYASLPEFAASIVMIELVEGSPVTAGWKYDGETFSEPDPIEPAVPSRVTMRQARLALHVSGLLTQVQSAIDNLPEPPRIAAQIEWDYSSEMWRDREFVQMLGSQLGLTSQQIDDLFTLAATL